MWRHGRWRQLIGTRTPEQARLFADGSGQLTVPLRLNGERARQFGDVYMALTLWRGTGLRVAHLVVPMQKETSKPLWPKK